MCTRISKAVGGVVLPLLALSGCGLTEDRSDNRALVAAEQEVEKEAVDDGKIACAVSGATAFSRSCYLEQSQTEQGLLLTVRHADGGFRKLQVVKDGRGVIAADGADKASVAIIGPKEIEVTLSGDRYRIPATVGTPPKPAAATPISKTGVKPKS
jgi:hypothetical protein